MGEQEDEASQRKSPKHVVIVGMSDPNPNLEAVSSNFMTETKTRIYSWSFLKSFGHTSHTHYYSHTALRPRNTGSKSWKPHLIPSL
jgi:hypothetical protein